MTIFLREKDTVYVDTEEGRPCDAEIGVVQLQAKECRGLLATTRR